MDQTDGDGMFGDQTENFGSFTREEWEAEETKEVEQMKRVDAQLERILTSLEAQIGKHTARRNLERELYAARATLKRVTELADRYEAKAEDFRRGGGYLLQNLFIDAAMNIREALNGEEA